MSTLVHLALGDSAAGCLRGACQAHGLPGIAVGIPDDLSHGPLDDGYARINYMRAMYSGYDDWTFDANDAFAPWSALIGQLDRERPEAVVIWSGDNVSEGTFLAMACWQLQHRSQAICMVAVPSENGPPYVAHQSPAELTRLYPCNQQLPDHKRAMLVEGFERIRRELTLFNLAINSKLRGCDLVKLRVRPRYVTHDAHVLSRATFVQQKTQPGALRTHGADMRVGRGLDHRGEALRR